MVSDTPKQKQLLPARHQQHDLFLCDVSDAILKDDMASMEHPFFSLSKKPEISIKRYENGNKWIEIVPSVKGLATIYDKDILIYCISQMIAKMNEGVEPNPNVRIVAKDLLIFTNRTTGGKDYETLRDALDRLDGTRIRTNIITGGIEEYKGFGLIESFEIRRSEKSGRILEMRVKLSDWVFRSIAAKEVLTLHQDYFRLRKPIERRVYEIARKHCGKQESWRVSIETLKRKCGSKATLKGFRFAIKELAKGGHLPDYSIAYEIEKDHAIFRNRALTNTSAKGINDNFLTLDPEAYHDARLVAPNYDVYYLEREWQNWWVESGKPEIKNPNKAFIGFCKSRYERKPNP